MTVTSGGTKLSALKVYVAAVELHCPTCVKEIPTPNGSLFWCMDELPEHVVGCPSCHKDYRFPLLGFMKRKQS